MTPFPRCSTHQLPPAPSDLKILLHRDETSSPISKPAGGKRSRRILGRSLEESQPRRGSAAISKGRTGLTVACPRVSQPAGWSGKEPQHLCRHTCAPAVLHLDPGCLQALRVGLRNYFYTSVRACNIQGVICIIPPSRPSLSTNTSASWNFFFLSLHHSISRSRMLFSHQVSPFATCGSKPFLGSGAKRNWKQVVWETLCPELVFCDLPLCSQVSVCS